MKKLLLTASLLVSFAMMSQTIEISRFGAIPDDGKDDTKALRKAAEYCRTHPGTTLSIGPGVYLLRDRDAMELEEKACAGEFGENIEPTVFTPYYPYVKGLDFGGCRDVTVMAEGATLLCDGWMEPVSITGSTGFTLKGLTIDYLRKPFSHGTVTSVGDSWFDVEFSGEREITDRLPLMRMTFWNPKYNRVDPNVLYFPRRELRGGNTVRFHSHIPDSLAGSTANVNHCFHFRPAILILESSNTTIDNVTIHSQPGMGIVGFDSRDVTMRNLSVRPAAGYSQSTNTDATHFAACEGTIRFEGCYFQGQGDDATNVHGYYQSIIHADGKTARLQIKAPTYTHAQVIDAPRPGDVMELVEISTLRPAGTFTVESSAHKPEGTICDVTFTEPLPADCGQYYMMNITKLPRLEFENNMVNSHLARGVLVKTRGAVIRNNVFRHCTGTAIHVGAEASWHEGTHAKDITITGNVMTGCGSGAGSQGGASGISVIIEAADTSESLLHDGITISNNMIYGENNPCGIFVGNARNVTLENNAVRNCRTDIVTRTTLDVTVRQ